jgi:hypothetical protein
MTLTHRKQHRPHQEGHAVVLKTEAEGSQIQPKDAKGKGVSRSLLAQLDEKAEANLL